MAHAKELPYGRIELHPARRLMLEAPPIPLTQASLSLSRTTLRSSVCFCVVILCHHIPQLRTSENAEQVVLSVHAMVKEENRECCL